MILKKSIYFKRWNWEKRGQAYCFTKAQGYLSSHHNDRGRCGINDPNVAGQAWLPISGHLQFNASWMQIIFWVRRLEKLNIFRSTETSSHKSIVDLYIQWSKRKRKTTSNNFSVSSNSSKRRSSIKFIIYHDLPPYLHWIYLGLLDICCSNIASCRRAHLQLTQQATLLVTQNMASNSACFWFWSDFKTPIQRNLTKKVPTHISSVFFSAVDLSWTPTQLASEVVTTPTGVST